MYVIILCYEEHNITYSSFLIYIFILQPNFVAVRTIYNVLAKK